MGNTMTGLNDKEFKDFNDIVQNTLNSLIACADKHNIDRDSFVKYFLQYSARWQRLVPSQITHVQQKKEAVRGNGEIY